MGEGDLHSGMHTPSSISCANECSEDTFTACVIEPAEDTQESSLDDVVGFRVDDIIDRAANEIVVAAEFHEYSIEPPCNFEEQDSLLVHAPTPSASRGQRTMGRHMGTGGKWDPARGADIAKILHAPRRPSEVREYAAKAQYWRVPNYLRQVAEELDAEQRYIVSLDNSREDQPKAPVRLLRQGEKDELVHGLKQQFQQASACILKAGKKSGAKAKLEERLGRISQDIENLSRPYIFVQAEAAK